VSPLQMGDSEYVTTCRSFLLSYVFSLFDGYFLKGVFRFFFAELDGIGHFAYVFAEIGKNMSFLWHY
jgi:hypothetical protein